MAAKKQAVDFEKSLGELETLVNELEKGDMSLEDSLKAFEAGVKLTRDCQSRLTEAEQRVHTLIESQGEMSLQTFNNPDAGQ
jgi:exodeoxyribonuclease VII small subunit